MTSAIASATTTRALKSLSKGAAMGIVATIAKKVLKETSNPEKEKEALFKEYLKQHAGNILEIELPEEVNEPIESNLTSLSLSHSIKSTK